jgi:hypothetical protein
MEPDDVFVDLALELCRKQDAFDQALFEWSVTPADYQPGGPHELAARKANAARKERDEASAQLMGHWRSNVTQR